MSIFKNSLLVVSLVFSLFLAKDAYAHPNVMIEYRIFFKFDKYSVTDVTQSWVLDKTTSKELMQKYHIDQNLKLDKKQSHKLAKKIMEGLYELRYFTYIYINDNDIGKIKASNIKAQIKNGVISLAFNNHLPRAVDVRKDKLSVEVKDPDSSVITVLAEKKPTILIGAPSDTCKTKIKQKSNPMNNSMFKQDMFSTAMLFPLKKVVLYCE
jgi:ABC-type uncharacterized transport system substrate-binding protein